jgi:hypothetical protein
MEPEVQEWELEQIPVICPLLGRPPQLAVLLPAKRLGLLKVHVSSCLP